MKQKILMLLIVLCSLLPASAQQSAKSKKSGRTVVLTAYLKDSFTLVKLRGFATLMLEDSTVVDTMTCDGWQRNYSADFRVPAKPMRYILKGECDGYEPCYINYELKHIARNAFFRIPDVLLKKRAQSDIYKEVDLDGVVVTGTKVKFTYRGDTLVYNASAFNVPDGSMLDALVRQLPGAELKSNGDIYINGKKIDYLTLNGKDFFKGDNKVMLDNLPHYTVQDLKVYNKSTEKSKFIGHDVEKPDYVMDVSLKRDYNRGYIANAETAGGTRDRYMGRLFGLYYDDYTRFSVFGNINNVNENRTPGANGDWKPSNMPQGQTITKQVGANFNTQNRKGSLKDNAEFSVKWNDATDITRNASESFASAGNIFSRYASHTRQKDMRVNVGNNVSYTDESSFYLYSGTSLSYTDGTSESATRRATYDADPKAWGGVAEVLDSTFSAQRNAAIDNAINRSQTLGWRKYKTLRLTQEVLLGGKLPWGDVVGLMLEGIYTSNKPQDNFGLSGNDYLREQRGDLRNVYTDSHNHSYRFNAMVDYRITLGSYGILASQGYRQEMSVNKNLNYRLERLEGGYARFDSQVLGMLPSTRDSMQMALDAHNSQTYNLMKRTYKGELQFNYNKDRTLLILSLPYQLVRERINYRQASLDTTATRHKLMFFPNLYFSMSKKNGFFMWGGYNMECQQPEMASLMPTDNDIDPLARRINNPSLKDIIRNSFSAQVNVPVKKHRLSFGVSGTFTSNMIGTRTTYNTKTGAYTYMSDNVESGNWSMGTNARYYGKLDKKGLLALENGIRYDYTKSTDFDIAYDDKPTALSKVNTSTISDNINLIFEKGDLRVTLGADGQWRHSTGNRENFQTLDAWDYNYGMTLAYKLPLGLQLATDLKQYSRRGYGESSMNTDDLVWNASLTRSFCKGRLTLKAEAFDLLHQLSNTTYTVNAQARTEVWRNSIPNYCMVHLTYKITKTPKK